MCFTATGQIQPNDQVILSQVFTDVSEVSDGAPIAGENDNGRTIAADDSVDLPSRTKFYVSTLKHRCISSNMCRNVGGPQ